MTDVAIKPRPSNLREQEDGGGEDLQIKLLGLSKGLGFEALEQVRISGLFTDDWPWACSK